MPAEGQQVQRQQYMYPHAAPVASQVQSAVARETHQGMCYSEHTVYRSTFCGEQIHIHGEQGWHPG